jgi:ADP-ribosylation factor related protein 1
MRKSSLIAVFIGATGKIQISAARAGQTLATRARSCGSAGRCLAPLRGIGGVPHAIPSRNFMFHLALSLYTQYTKREQYNVLILGLDNAGKTTFLEHLKLLYASPESHKTVNADAVDTTIALKRKRILPTVGQNTTTIRFEALPESGLAKSYNNINLKFWDLGGQQSLRSMWSRYFRQCHGIIFVIDSTDTARFEECYETLMEILHNPSWRSEDDDAELDDTTTVNVPILMMANKQDLPEAVDLVSLKTSVFIQAVSELEATDLKLLPVSVLENKGLRESLEWLVTRLVYNKSNKMPEYR